MINLIQNSTIHGLNHISTASNRYFKALWILLFTLGIGGIMINMVFIVQKFISNPIGVSRTVNYENFTWPDITFCNPSSPYNLDRDIVFLEHWKEVNNRSKAFLKSVIDNWEVLLAASFKSKLGDKYLTMFSVSAEKLKFDYYYNLINRIDYGFTYVDSFLDMHKMADEQYLSDNREDIQSTENVLIHTNIPCHTLHVENSKTLKDKQIKYLNIRVHLNFDDFQFYSKSFPYKSMFLYITNENHVKGMNKITLEPGYKNIITVSQTDHRKNGVRYPCRKIDFVVELYDALLHSIKHYKGNYQDCLQVARQRKFVQKCNCYSPFLPIYKNESGSPRLCFNMSIYTTNELRNNFLCVFENSAALFKETRRYRRELREECAKFLNDKCDEIVYKVELVKENLEYLSIVSLEDIKSNDENGTNWRNVQRNELHVIIKKESEFVDLFEEELLYPFSQFLSDIGGLMGLWLGLSIIGLFEIVEFSYRFLKDRFQNRMKLSQSVVV